MHSFAGLASERRGGSVDERVAMAISHWAPRFTMNGVTAGDFERITSGLERWADWCAAWSAVGAEHEELGRDALAAGREMSAGAHLSQAAVYYHFAKFLFVDDLDQMRTAHMAAVRCLNDALPYMDPPGRRIEIPFEGSHMVGVLRQPPGAGPHPVMIMIPGLDSTKEELLSTEAGLDADRIGVWGVSLGGYYAPRVASGDDRVRACVALAGPFVFSENWDQRPILTREAFRVRSKSADMDAARDAAGKLSMVGRAELITCPLLAVMGKLDRLIPWEQAARLVKEAGGPAELLLLEQGNHGCANLAPFHRYQTADWVAEQLGARTGRLAGAPQ